MNGTRPRTSPVSSDINLSRFIGRSYEQVNCWQLVREFYLGVFGLELQQYYAGGTPDADQTASLIRSNKGNFVRVEEPAFGDIMLIKVLGLECHVGIFISQGKFLHSLKGTGSVLDSLEKYKTRIVGYYRHTGALASD